MTSGELIDDSLKNFMSNHLRILVKVTSKLLIPLDEAATILRENVAFRIIFFEKIR